MTNIDDSYEHLDPSIVYTSISIPGVGCPEFFDEEFLEGCSCDISTNCTELCSCIKGTVSFYEENLRIKWPITKYPIFECNMKCQCSKRFCKNSVIKRGPIKGLFVKHVSKEKGLGLFCEHKITIGTFVCTYAGEVIGVEEDQKRAKIQQEAGKPNYIIFVKEFFNNAPLLTVIDPTVIGNIGRYCNHSCDPNLIMIPIRIENLIPHLALFASKDIPEGTELTFDYGNPSKIIEAEQNITNIESLTNKESEMLVKCLCNAQENCRKFLPYHK